MRLLELQIRILLELQIRMDYEQPRGLVVAVMEGSSTKSLSSLPGSVPHAIFLYLSPALLLGSLNNVRFSCRKISLFLWRNEGQAR